MSSVARDTGETGEGVEAPRTAIGTGRDLVPVLEAPAATGFAAFAGLGWSHGVIAAGAALTLGLSFVGGTAIFGGHQAPVAVAQVAPPADPTMDMLVRVQGEVRSLKASLDGLRATAENGRQDETIRNLKRSVDMLRGDLDGVKVASTAAVGQLGAKIDKLDRDPVAKLAEVAARLDRVERQVSSSDTTGSLPPQSAAVPLMAPKVPVAPQHAAQVPPAAPVAVAVVPPVRPDMTARSEPAKTDVVKPDPTKPEPVKVELPLRQEAAAHPADARPGSVDGWMLRDVYGGVALLEGRAGGLREVMPGEYIPGVGEIRSIERRGRGWVVVTSRGIIQADNRW